MCFGKVIWHNVETRSVNKWNNAWFVSGPQTALIERQQINSVPLLLSPAGVARISAVAGRPHVSNATLSHRTTVLNTFQTLAVYYMNSNVFVVCLCLSFNYVLAPFLANFHWEINLYSDYHHG